jgi:hypothetical protein
MFTQIQICNDKAMVSGAELKKIILVRLPYKILEQMHTVNLTGKTHDEIICIITNAGRTAEKYKAAKNNVGLKKPICKVHKKTLRKTQFNKETRFDKPMTFKNRFQGQRNNQSGEGFKAGN